VWDWCWSGESECSLVTKLREENVVCVRVDVSGCISGSSSDSEGSDKILL
jgi:hypothetical protein